MKEKYYIDETGCSCGVTLEQMDEIGEDAIQHLRKHKEEVK